MKRIPLYKNEEWCNFAIRMHVDHQCRHTFYLLSPMHHWFQFLRLCHRWYADDKLKIRRYQHLLKKVIFPIIDTKNANW